MTDKLKKLVREFAARNNISHQAAHNILTRAKGRSDAATPTEESDLDPMDVIRFLASQPRVFMVSAGTLYQEGDAPLTEHERVDHYECRGCGKDLPLRVWTDDSLAAKALGPANFHGYAIVCESCQTQTKPLSRAEAVALIKDVASKSESN